MVHYIFADLNLTSRLAQGRSLGREDLMVDVVQRGAVSHMKRPEQRAPLLLDLLCLKHTIIIIIIFIVIIIKDSFRYPDTN